MLNKNKKILFILILFITFAFTRFLKVPDFFNFGIDEEYQALLSWSIVKDFHIILIGVSASNIGYYLGPGLTYLGALLLWLTKGNPLIFAYFASFVGVLTAISLYFVVRSLFNQRTAVISFILYGFSPFAFYYDRRYWPIGVPLIALWLFFSLVKAFKNPRWLLFTALLMGVSYHLHISLWLFWPIILFIFVFLISKRKISFVIIFQSALIFFISTLPLFVFDLVHNFDNLTMPLRLVTRDKSTTYVLSPISRILSFVQSITKIWVVNSNSLISYFLFSLFLIFCLYLLFKQKTVRIRILLLVIFLFIVGFIFFPSPMQEYYFVLVLPFIVITSALFLELLPKFKYLLLIIFVLINSWSIFKNPVYGNYKPKMEVIKKTSMIIKKAPFALEIKNAYISNGGWRYLFQSFGLTPVQSNADSMFGWIYPDEISNTKPKYRVIILKDNNFIIVSE